MTHPIRVFNEDEAPAGKRALLIMPSDGSRPMAWAKWCERAGSGARTAANIEECVELAAGGSMVVDDGFI